MFARLVVGKFAMALTLFGLLVAWAVLVAVFVPLLSAVGISQQISAGILSVLFFVAFWVVGLKFLLGGTADKDAVPVAERSGQSQKPNTVESETNGRTAPHGHDNRPHTQERDAHSDTHEQDDHPDTHEQEVELLRHNWWHVIAVVAVATVVTPVTNNVFLAVAEPHHLLYLPAVVTALPVLLLFLAIAIPVAFYYDTKYVRAVNEEWQPSSPVYGLVGVVVMVGSVVLVRHPALVLCGAFCGWYLYKRHVHVGVPSLGYVSNFLSNDS